VTIRNAVCMYCRDPVAVHDEDQLSMCMSLMDASETGDLVDVDVESACPCGAGGNDCLCWDEMWAEPNDEEDTTTP
jgi:hypothetical protein